MTVLSKLKWILGILMVFLIILTTNLIDQSNFLQVRNSITSIYEDRLIANDLIIKMLKHTSDFELALCNHNTLSKGSHNDLVNENFKLLMLAYEETNLTPEEEMLYGSFREKVVQAEQLQQDLTSESEQKPAELLRQIERMEQDLYGLSEIQLKEGRKQVQLSQRAFITVQLFTRIEIYILIILAIVVQIIVIYKPK